jgi:threonine dehydratase
VFSFKLRGAYNKIANLSETTMHRVSRWRRVAAASPP